MVGGAGASAGGSKVQINHLSAGRIPDGATVERAVPTPLAEGEYAAARTERDRLRHRAARSSRRSTRRMGAGTADGAGRPRDPRAHAPVGSDARVAFMAASRTSTIKPAQAAAKVVINARTGSVVMNQAVTLDACAVAHGNLSVMINTDAGDQPAGAVRPSGQTVVTREGRHHDQAAAGSADPAAGRRQLADVVKALNALGATPQDLLAILQAMKAAGALHAELEII